MVSPPAHVALLWVAVGASVALGSGILLDELTVCYLKSKRVEVKEENTHYRKRRGGITLVFISMHHFHRYLFDYRSNSSSLSLSILTQLSLCYYNQTDTEELTKFE